MPLPCIWAELAVSELPGNGAGILAAANIIISTFLLVFVAEWSDKSFFSTSGEIPSREFIIIRKIVTLAGNNYV
jgi:hypothetical protein